MTPAEQLAAARSDVVGPYIPATEALLDGWCGPAVTDTGGAVLSAGLDGGRAYWYDLDGDVFDFGDAGSLRLDLRRPEVQDHLVRRGAPEWARKLPAALWVWATTGIAPRRPTPKWVQFGEHYVRAGSPANSIASVCDTRGWAHGEDFGPETGPEGMACADLAALSHGCILEEADGWLVPLPDGGIGFWPKP